MGVIAAAAGARRRARLDDARLYVVSEARTPSGRLAALIPGLARAGVDVVQLRDRRLDPAGLREEARACAAAADAAGVLFIVNDSPELARASGADGVHIGQADGAVAAARALLGPDRIVGRSTRGGAMLDRAAAEGADYASVGPVWETPTKPGRPAVGLAAVADAARRARIPWFAIGGIDARRVGRVAAVGATRCVVVRAVRDALDPLGAAALLRERLVGAVPRILSVASTDSGGGAGLLADVKAIVRAGGFPLCAVAAVTAQTTIGVDAHAPIDADLVRRQVAAVAGDLGIDGVKTGMLAVPAIVEVVAEALAALDPADEVPVVVDPVLRAESGASLMGDGGEAAYRRVLLPRARVVTPNLFEAQALTGIAADDPERLAREIHGRYGCAAIVTGGHGARSSDTLCDDAGVLEIPGPRLDARTTHGAGCTHSSTLATLLARGVPLREAAAGAKATATGAVAAGRPLGAGAGPVDVVAAR
ncbi:bifunctional hydroxymethylpyrimidine kinase/phosphomethylpyrimidine kinase [Miltoncostaea oceani]|uniref:bifunctional hydroxymethylpyrimidine kinase/phosphomethylpyrimidine kinase n=1 Tax=Miltoncostaea oceani TaxID=2843216 RepID=UPI001C3D571F|nr:bifunctional hydroxymethylpyrimidine kinase/phosphomethylpyrimidine kinase [Miltoncostaea oceani]